MEWWARDSEEKRSHTVKFMDRYLEALTEYNKPVKRAKKNS